MFTAVLFAVALGLVAVASVTHEAVWLFVAWVPLLAVPWVLTRPEPLPAAVVATAEPVGARAAEPEPEPPEEPL